MNVQTYLFPSSVPCGSTRAGLSLPENRATHVGGLLWRGTEWDITAPGVSETNSHKPPTIQGLAHTQRHMRTAREWQFTWTRHVAYTRPTHMSSPLALAPAQSPGTHMQTQLQKAGWYLTHAQQTVAYLVWLAESALWGSCIPLRNDGWHLGAPDWNLLLPSKC